ncbi:ACP S-malonyltransferase [Bacillus velezensis]|uniref:ACP S-malonyltransferase n=1 Tax=Bacillus velezensis TaxID=492670 RepID=UPI002DBF62EC|nr:ACP S-malonyltransferase [Bacillus velezensis]MEC0405497.1 ACP S-malonyltransferase [Bacillus velezensis]
MLTFVFPGQGSQFKGMGAGLFDEFQDLTRQADDILGYSIEELCLEDPNHQLGKTQFTQPALYTVSALSYLKKMKESGREPDYAAGHSLGEYNALFSAGCFDFETGLQLVKKRGELMSKAAPGGMAAVLGFTAEQVKEVLSDYHLTGIDIANHNSPSQIVIAGTKQDIEKAGPVFEKAGVRMYLPLNVSGAFHSRYMKDAEKEFADYLEETAFLPLRFPVISNLHAAPYKNDEIKTNLTLQMTNQVKWTDTIRRLMGLENNEIAEVGPGEVLTKLTRQIKKDAVPLPMPKEESDTADVKASAADSQKTAGMRLGNEDFKKEYNIQYAYMTGSMYRGIASEQMVIKAAKAGMLGFFGTGGLSIERIGQAIGTIRSALRQGETFGMNLLHHMMSSDKEVRMIDLYLKNGIHLIEASAFMGITPALVIYRAKGLSRNHDGSVSVQNRIIAKVSRPEVAEAFLSPAPAHVLERLVSDNRLTAGEAALAKEIPMADDICVEADSGGHTDQGIPYTLMPAMIRLRDRMMEKHGYAKKVRIGAAGGIGTPEAAAAAFLLGAEFIGTGSINQCTVEAGTSDSVKDLLQEANVQDTSYAPAGDMFEAGARVQVLKKGLFFPARANKLFDLYRQYNSLDEIDEKTKTLIEEKYFQRSFEEVYEQLKRDKSPAQIAKAEQNPKHKMAMVFKWYFSHTTRLALEGKSESKIDYQIHCGPALGAFNQWVKGTPLENWRNRHVDLIGKQLMEETAGLLAQRLVSITG